MTIHARQLLTVAFACLISHAGSAAASCQPLVATETQSIADLFDMPVSSIETLQNVHKRISTAAEIPAKLYICNDSRPNAFAFNGEIAITTSLLKLVNGEPDLLARIIGHEMAHIALRHDVQKMIVNANVLSQAIDQARRDYEKKQDATRAYGVLEKYFVLKSSLYSRAFEKDADDLGIDYTIKAGFGLRTAEKMSALLKTVGEKGATDYFSSHPGYMERYQAGDYIEKNEAARRQAAALLLAKKTAQLKPAVDKWLLAIPDSGAVYYYQARLKEMEQAPHWVVVRAYEDSAEAYQSAVLGRFSQWGQPEWDTVPLALCVALYREDRKEKALECTRKLDDKALDEFRKQTGWNTVLIVSPEMMGDSRSTLWSAGTAGDGVFLTNMHTAENDKQLRRVRAWKAIRDTSVSGPANSSSNRPAKTPPTDLAEAARAGDNESVYALVQRGADPNALINGVTPLGVAALANQESTVNYLLKLGARPGLHDGFRKTASDYARQAGAYDIVSALRVAGAGD